MSVCLKPDGISSSTSWLPIFTIPSTYQHVENAKSVHKISTFFCATLMTEIFKYDVAAVISSRSPLQSE